MIKHYYLIGVSGDMTLIPNRIEIVVIINNINYNYQVFTALINVFQQWRSVGVSRKYKQKN